MRKSTLAYVCAAPVGSNKSVRDERTTYKYKHSHNAKTKHPTKQPGDAVLEIGGAPLGLCMVGDLRKHKLSGHEILLSL